MQIGVADQEPLEEYTSCRVCGPVLDVLFLLQARIDLWLSVALRDDLVEAHISEAEDTPQAACGQTDGRGFPCC